MIKLLVAKVVRIIGRLLFIEHRLNQKVYILDSACAGSHGVLKLQETVILDGRSINLL